MISNRVAVVTGANKGIGFYTVLRLASSGLFSHIILGCRDATRGQTAVEKIQHQLPEPYKTQTKVSFLDLTVGDTQSHLEFQKSLEGMYDKLDVLVNNAGILVRDRDPTSTLDINYRGTVHLTQTLLPLLRKGTDPRVINVASQLGHLDSISSTTLKKRLESPSLTLPEIDGLVNQYETSVKRGSHAQEGWGHFPYGMSKLFLIGATKVMARHEVEVEKSEVKINAVCPGRCATDLTSMSGFRSPVDGAEIVVIPAIMPREECPSGEFFKDYKITKW